MNKERGQLAANLRGDREGLPGWYTHFGSESFAKSALPVFAEHLSERYDKEKPLTIVGLGAGSAFYERAVSRALQEDDWNPQLLVSDLQEGSLRTIPKEDFPVVPILSDSTKLPLLDGENRESHHGGTLVLSRAVEHYLPQAVQQDLIAEAGRVLAASELYAAQLSSGEPLAIGALSAGLKGIADKEVSYLTVDAYRNRVASIVYPDASPVFQEIAVGAADTQTDRGASAQARRYLNPNFLSLHAQEAGDSLTTHYFAQEIDFVTSERDRLRKEVQFGSDREQAIKELDEVIESTEVSSFFRSMYVRSVREYLQEQGIDPQPGLDVPGVRIHGRENVIEDIELDISYPIVVLEKQPRI